MWNITMRHPETPWNARRAGKKLIDDPRKPYASLTDANVHITRVGYNQCIEAEKFLNKLFVLCPQDANAEVKMNTSLSMRTREAAPPIARAMRKNGLEIIKSNQRKNKDFEAQPLLIEMDFGEWSDMSKEEVEAMYEQHAAIQVALGKAAGLSERQLEFMENQAMFPLTHFKKLKNDKLTGGLHARPPNGESPYDVWLRMVDYKEIIEDWAAQGITRSFDIAHGIVSQLKPLVMLGRDPYDFAKEKNPGNTAMRLITDDGEGGYIDHGYIYDPSRGIDVTKDSKRLKKLQKHFH